MTQKTARGGQDREAGAWPVGLSRAVLIWERLEAAFWQPAAFALVFLFIALTGLLPDLPIWAHIAVLAVSAAIFLGLAWRGARSLTWPDRISARRRIELVNGLDHRPLESLADRPSTDDPIQLALWEEHRRRIAARIRALSVGAPAPQLARLDPMALRIFAMVLLVAGLGMAGRDAPARLAEALLPTGSATTAGLAIGIDAWLAPPQYTGLPPQFIARSGDPASQDEAAAPSGPDHTAPVGSKLVIQVTGDIPNADLVTPNATIPFTAFAEGGFAIEHEVTSTGPVTVLSDGRELAGWVIHTVADEAPVVTLPEPPAPSLQQALTITHTVSDDYGIVSLSAIIERADRPIGSAQSSAEGDEEMAIVSPFPVPDIAKYGKQRRVYRDYTPHPWAGGEVRLTLVATDALGQEGRSEPVTLILPARKFNHPVAQIIVELRRELAWDPGRNRLPVADALEAVAWGHENYGDDVTVFLSLREAYSRLRRPKRGDLSGKEAVDEVVDLLWKTALYLEDGGVSLALARLRAAEQALMEALAEGASDAELERLMNELQSAMNDYMSAMTEQLRQSMEDGEEVPQFNPGDNMISTQDINEMMDQIREMMRNGMTESATQMLEQLRRMMENMQAGMQTQMSQENREAMQLLENMKDIMEGQRELMERTHRQNQQRGQQGQNQRNGAQDGQSQNQADGNQGQQGGQGGADAVLQDALRRQLGEIMRQFGEMMGEIPEPFGRADEGMAESSERLGQGEPGEALGAQGQAMDALQEAAEAARDAFMERFDRQMGLGQQMPGQSGQQTMDPFGRQASETFRGPMQGEVDVPDEGSLERAREIRDELRRRAGQRNRSSEELDYIDRLLDQFQ